MKRSIPNLLILCLLIFTPTLSRVADAACSSPPHGLVAWWQAQWSSDDLIGGHSGMESGNYYDSGMVGDGSFAFDGYGYIEVASHADLKFTTAFTVEAWVALWNDSSGNRTIVAKGTDADVP